MSQRVALLISTSLTILILFAGVSLAIQVRRANADPDVVAAGAAPDDGPAADTDPTRDQEYQTYFEQLQAANSALAASYGRITALLDNIEQLRQQNAQLREREAQYQRLLTEANRRLQAQGQGRDALAIPPAAITAAARDRVPSAVQSRERKRERHDD
jgi:hypothetical protein